MNSGYVILNDKLSSLIIKKTSSPGSFEYKDAYKYFEDIYNTSKLIIANMADSIVGLSAKGTTFTQPAFQITKSVGTDKTSYSLSFSDYGTNYNALVDSSNKNLVTVSVIE